jgi:high-affinity nickel-transport protein
MLFSRTEFLLRRAGTKGDSLDALRQRAIALLSSLLLMGLFLWTLSVLILADNQSLLALAILAFAFGLRHAMDADHIAAIDSITRRLLSEGRQSVSVGFMFSLGHSTVVMVLSLLLILSVQQVRSALSHLMAFGGIFGGIVSALLLSMVGAANLVALWRSIGANRRKVGDPGSDHPLPAAYGGFFTLLLGRALRLVDRGWKIYGIGFLFGLGFDTASEIAILVISASAASRGMPLWHCLLFPLLFTSGMTLLDTVDNILILSACRWALTTPRGTRYYNAAMTLTTVLMALGIAAIEAWGLLLPAGGHTVRGQGMDSWVTIINQHFAATGTTFVVATGIIWLSLWLVYRVRTIPAHQRTTG